MRNTLLVFLLALCGPVLRAQPQDSITLGFAEYLAYVKQFHPVAKQANLVLSLGEANLLRSRGGFDPKLEVDYDRKQFKGTEYYDRLNAAFKIPTWYGVEFKGQFEQNEGDFLSPDQVVPTDGLYSAGVSVSVGRGLWINERMATLRKARLYARQSRAERDLQVNQVLYDASLAYFDWLQAYKDLLVYEQFRANAILRFRGIRESALAGDRAAIDTVEARIAVQNRELGLEQARVRYLQASLDLSNFLWMQDNTPVELQEGVTPDPDPAPAVAEALGIRDWIMDSLALEAHPKLRALEFKIEGLRVDQRLKTNELLPQIDLEYNFLTQTPEVIRSFETQQYKGGVTFRMPLFLRKERGALKMARFKLQDAQFERDNARLSIRNKVLGTFGALQSFDRQNALIAGMVSDYARMLQAEERKFSFGESSLFLVNSRERSLIDTRLKSNAVQNKYLQTQAKLFQVLGINPTEIAPPGTR
ncbi:TolC family protein [Robiginitalea sp. M366]|uniref:TolC family protein n=1 Tax=Robiginitalea aestuariiviva TaxID=3036903 RepID=UPI00240D3850|nr:TolC family protein [Robiginitalea aestuariiviva]MDG1571747.1 TolC family protein [Robiginitalea aestuariiviva]